MAFQKQNKRGWQIGVAMLAAGLMSTACADMDTANGDYVEGAAEVSDRPDQGKGNGSDVVTIGDSWMSNTLGTGDALSGGLRRLTKQNYKNYAVQGVMLLSTSLFGPAIPTQWDAASRSNKEIKTVIMTAGGNDVIQNAALQADCKTNGATCQAKLKDIGAALTSLWKKMGAAGVQDIVYVGYSEAAGGTDPRVANTNTNGTAAACAAITEAHCWSFDSTPVVKKTDLLADGIHPNQGTNDRLAKAVYSLMEEKGVRR